MHPQHSPNYERLFKKFNSPYHCSGPRIYSSEIGEAGKSGPQGCHWGSATLQSLRDFMSNDNSTAIYTSTCIHPQKILENKKLIKKKWTARILNTSDTEK